MQGRAFWEGPSGYCAAIFSIEHARRWGRVKGEKVIRVLARVLSYGIGLEYDSHIVYYKSYIQGD